jgi:RNA polymerase sigma-70 factor (sigma-E family)
MSDAVANTLANDPSGRLAAAHPDRPRGDTQANSRVAAAYDTHAPRLGRLAYLLTGDAALAEDLVQEAFTRAFARFAHLRRPDALSGYLRRTVINLAYKRQRRLRTEQTHAPKFDTRADVVSQPDVAVRAEIWDALRELPYRQRAALVLRFYEDMTEKEIARAMGCPTGTVKSSLHRGLAALRELPYRQRAALVLRFYEDMTEKEIARAMGCPTGTVKSSLHTGLAALRERIGGEEQ